MAHWTPEVQWGPCHGMWVHRLGWQQGSLLSHSYLAHSYSLNEACIIFCQILVWETFIGCEVFLHSPAPWALEQCSSRQTAFVQLSNVTGSSCHHPVQQRSLLYQDSPSISRVSACMSRLNDNFIKYIQETDQLSIQMMQIGNQFIMTTQKSKECISVFIYTLLRSLLLLNLM